jgi:RimJ/RimL family protein N-acetyltransferase
MLDLPDLRIRPVGPGDEALVARLLDGLDERSRYRRWFTGAVDLHKAAAWAAHPERAAAVGLLAVAGEELVGHAVLVPLPDGSRGEVAFEVAAAWRHHGVAGALLGHLVVAAAALELREVYAEVLLENADMLAVLREHGEHAEHRDGNVVTVTLPVPGRTTTEPDGGRLRTSGRPRGSTMEACPTSTAPPARSSCSPTSSSTA